MQSSVYLFPQIPSDRIVYCFLTIKFRLDSGMLFFFLLARNIRVLCLSQSIIIMKFYILCLCSNSGGLKFHYLAKVVSTTFLSSEDTFLPLLQSDLCENTMRPCIYSDVWWWCHFFFTLSDGHVATGRAFPFTYSLIL